MWYRVLRIKALFAISRTNRVLKNVRARERRSQEELNSRRKFYQPKYFFFQTKYCYESERPQ